MSDSGAAGRRLEKFPAFDGFRGIGVLVVVFSHCPQVLESSAYNFVWQLNQLSRIGYVALDIFFVISGFFITRLLLRERAKTGRISFRNFYARRALRIFPVYYMAILLCYFIFHLGTADTLSLLTYTFNFYHPFHPAPHPLEHTWSLSVEEQFYFFWPLLILLVPPRWLNVVIGRVIPVLAVMSGLAIAWMLGTDRQLLAGDAVYMSLFTRMLSLSLGGWLALREFEGRPLRGWRCLVLVVVALVVLVIDRAGRDRGIITSQAIYWTVALVAYAMFSVAFVSTLVFDRGMLQRWVTAFLSLPALRWLGYISYAMYVAHLPVLFYLGLNDGALAGQKAHLGQVGLAFAITIAIATLSYVLIEHPLSSLKGRFAGAAQAPASSPAGPAVAGILSGGVGAAGESTGRVGAWMALCNVVAGFARTAASSPKDDQKGDRRST
ncbi:MAG: acyltransferase [Tardiphaga sp.]